MAAFERADAQAPGRPFDSFAQSLKAGSVPDNPTSLSGQVFFLGAIEWLVPSGWSRPSRPRKHLARRPSWVQQQPSPLPSLLKLQLLRQQVFDAVEAGDRVGLEVLDL